MNIKDFKELVNSILDEQDNGEVYMRFANGDYDNRHYTVSSVIPMAILECSGTIHLAIGCTLMKKQLKYKMILQSGLQNNLEEIYSNII